MQKRGQRLLYASALPNSFYLLKPNGYALVFSVSVYQGQGFYGRHMKFYSAGTLNMVSGAWCDSQTKRFVSKMRYVHQL